MDKFCKFITGIGVLGLLGYIVYRNVAENQYTYGLMVMVVAFFAFVLVVYQCGNRQGEDKINYWPVIYFLLAISTMANIFIYIKTSYTPLTDGTRNWKMQTVNEWFLPETSQEVEISVSYWSLFSDTVLSNLLAERTVLVQDILVEDIRAMAAVAQGELKTFAGISKEGIQKYVEKYVPQEIVFISEQGKVQKLYMVTGTVWEDESNNIYVILDEEGNVWMIPDRLLNSQYKTEKEFCYEYQDVFQDENLEKIMFNYRLDMVTEKLFADRENNSASNILYLLFLYGTGFLILLPFSNKIASEFIVYLSVPVGALLEIISCIVIGCILGIEISKKAIVSGIFILIVLLWTMWLWKGKEKKLRFRVSFNASIAIGIIVFAVIFASVWHKVFLSYDSVRNIVLAQNIVRDGSFREYFAKVSDYSLFMPVVNIGAVLFDVQILYAFIPVLVCSCLGMTWLILKKHLQGVTNIQKYAVLICCFAAVITVPMFQLNIVWILNNLGIGLYYIGAIAMFLEGSRTSNKYYKYLALPLFIFASTARIETPIFGAAFLLIWDMVDEGIAKKCSVGLGIATVIVFLLNFAFNRDGEIFWSVSKGGVVLGAVWCIVFYFYVMKEWKVWQEITKKISLQILIEIGLLFGILVISIFVKQEIAISNLQALISSLLTTGIYGIIWIIYLFSFIFELKRERKDVQVIRAIRGIINVNFLITFAVMLFRDIPLRTTYTDSGGRMMLHVLPLVIVYFVYIFRNVMMEKEM